MARDGMTFHDKNALLAGSALKSIRLELGMSTREVERQSERYASEIGDRRFRVSHSGLLQIENGVRPNLYVLETLAATYRRDLSDICDLYNHTSAELSPQHALQEEKRMRVRIERLRGDRGSFAAMLSSEIDWRRNAFVAKLASYFDESSSELRRLDEQFAGPFGYVGIATEGPSFPLPSGLVVQLDVASAKIDRLMTGSLDWSIYFVEHRAGFLCGWCKLVADRLVVVSSGRQCVRTYSPQEVDIVGRVTGALLALRWPTRNHSSLPGKPSSTFRATA